MDAFCIGGMEVGLPCVVMLSSPCVSRCNQLTSPQDPCATHVIKGVCAGGLWLWGTRCGVLLCRELLPPSLRGAPSARNVKGSYRAWQPDLATMCSSSKNWTCPDVWGKRCCGLLLVCGEQQHGAMRLFQYKNETQLCLRHGRCRCLTCSTNLHALQDRIAGSVAAAKA